MVNRLGTVIVAVEQRQTVVERDQILSLTNDAADRGDIIRVGILAEQIAHGVVILHRIRRRSHCIRLRFRELIQVDPCIQRGCRSLLPCKAVGYRSQAFTLDDLLCIRAVFSSSEAPLHMAPIDASLSSPVQGVFQLKLQNTIG